MIRYQTA
jgi:hypothetical protein